MAVIVATVLVHGNEPGAREVLRLLAAQDRLPDAVVVMDNGSVPPVSTMTCAQIPVRFVCAERNIGVGGGHNLAISSALQDHGADYVWVLEHDTFPDPNCLRLLEQVAQHQHPGVVVPDATRNNYERMWLQGGSNGEAATRFTFNGVLIAREVVELVGPINEANFIGQEDWDYSQRVLASGMPITRCATAVVVHANKGDGRFDGYVSPVRLYYSVRNAAAADTPMTARGTARALAVCLAKCCLAFMTRGRGPRYAAAYWWAYSDARHGRMGQRVHRSLQQIGDPHTFVPDPASPAAL